MAERETSSRSESESEGFSLTLSKVKGFGDLRAAFGKVVRTRRSEQLQFPPTPKSAPTPGPSKLLSLLGSEAEQSALLKQYVTFLTEEWGWRRPNCQRIFLPSSVLCSDI